MNTKIVLSILAVIFFSFLASSILAQPYEVPVRTGIGTDKNIVYIGVDRNRIINETDNRQQKNYKNQPVNPTDESKYKIDIENWVEPKEPSRSLSPRREDMQFGRGMGVDMDLVRDSDAFSSRGGAIDARESQYIREDISK